MQCLPSSSIDVSGHACLPFHRHSCVGPPQSFKQLRRLSFTLRKRRNPQNSSSFGKIVRKGWSKKSSFCSLKATTAASDTDLQGNGASTSTREGASTDLSVIWSRLLKVHHHLHPDLSGQHCDCIEVSTERMTSAAFPHHSHS